MQPVEIKKDIFWVGSVDWKSRDFHGYSLSPRGTTYNAYVLLDEQTVLFDTVKKESWSEFRCGLRQVLGDRKLDVFVVNHVELDHSGCLPMVVEEFKPAKIVCSVMGQRSMDAHFHQQGWPVQTVKTGDSINVGKRDIHFMETRMLHWPDSMVSYIPQDKLLVSQDAFGQNIASSERFADQYDRAVLERAMTEYYANIVLPYSAVTLKTLDAVAEAGLDIDMIAPDHGLIFRGKEDVAYALDLYRKFAEQKPARKAVIFYDTMWKSTETMAKAIASGLEQEGVSVKLMWLKANHHSAVMSEVMDAAAVIAGSPTHNNTIMPGVAQMLTYMKGLRPQNKIGAAFGSFGWSGECVKILSEWLEKMEFELPVEPVKVKHVPTHDDLAKCVELGRAVGKAVNAKVG